MLPSHVTLLVRLLTRVIPNRIAAQTGKSDHQSGLAACYRLPRLLSCEGFPRKHRRDYLVLLRVGRSFVALKPRTHRVTCVYRPSLILWVGFAIGLRSAGLKFVRWVRCHCVDAHPLSSLVTDRKFTSNYPTPDLCCESGSPTPALHSVLLCPSSGRRLHSRGSLVSITLHILSSTPVSHHSGLLFGIFLSCAYRHTRHRRLGSC